MSTIITPSSHSTKVTLQSGLREPAACATKADKVKNLVALTKSLELSLREVERQHAFEAFVATSFSFLGIVKATSVAVLDLAAVLTEDNPRLAHLNMVAKGGKAGVVNAETFGEILAGNFDAAKAAERVSRSATSLMNNKAGEYLANKALDIGAVAYQSANGGVSGTDLARFAAGQKLDGVSYAFMTGNKSEQKIGRSIGSLKVLVDYGFELEKTLSEHSRFMDESKQRRENARKMFSQQLARLQQSLKFALADLSRCVEEHDLSQQAPLS